MTSAHRRNSVATGFGASDPAVAIVVITRKRAAGVSSGCQCGPADHGLPRRAIAVRQDLVQSGRLAPVDRQTISLADLNGARCEPALIVLRNPFGCILALLLMPVQVWRS